MVFYIYIIKNRKNKKFYIGKTTGSIQTRFKRHINDALSMRLNTHLAKAIRKDGEESFFIEILDTAKTEDELNQKEKYWIKHLDAVNKGYNSSDGGEGGDTYKHKTESEMTEIKRKISQTKLGDKNPHSRAIKCKNINTNQEMFFNTVVECKNYFQENNHNFITRRCSGKTKYVYANEWIFAYKENDYITDYSVEKKVNRRQKVKIVQISSKKEHIFSSYKNAEDYFKLPKGFFSNKAYRYKNREYWEKADFRIIVLE